MVKELDGNVYVRASVSGGSAAPLVTWGPAASDNCQSTFATLQEFRKVTSGFEAMGRQLDRTPRSVLKGIDLGHYDLLPNAGVPKNRIQLPAEVRKLLDWTEPDAQWPGAYPLRN
jgi:hypothetical protein